MKKLLSAVVSLALCLTLGACAKFPQPQETVVTLLNSYKEQSFDEFKNCFNDTTDFDVETSITEGLSEEEAELEELLLTKLTDIDYEILEETIEEDKATVKVKITANNLGEKLTEGVQAAFVLAFSLAFNEELTEEEIQKQINEAMISPIKYCEKNIEKTVEVNLVKGEEKWLIDANNNDLMLNAITGELLEFIEELEKMSSEETE